MSLGVLAAVLVGAFLHAAWNALIKTGADKLQGMLMLTWGHAAVGAVMALALGLPDPASWGWLAASVLIHCAYQSFLALAFTHGDLSRVYPISRGAAPLIVTALGALWLPDRLGAAEYAGILVLGAGILAMARGVFTDGESRRLLPFAFGAACATAAYTLADGQGARLAGSAGAYLAWLFMLSAVVFTPLAVRLGGSAVLRPSRRALLGGLGAGAMSVAAYWIAVWAMTRAPIALVAALRETSILFAMLIGVLAFGERLGARKALAGALILGGVILTRL
ncbi:MAG: peptide ABC transporter permease [Alphaproteobacteria bacterium]|nr:MAG: peptide ABC transporter permease [Alphaproteobacteria bacterium]